jgi:hypothetical protein
MGGGPAQLKRSLSRHRLNVGDAAHAIGSENLFCLRHVVIETLEYRFVNRKLWQVNAEPWSSEVKWALMAS